MPSKHPKRKPSLLDGFSPVEREYFAKWLEKHVRKFPDLINRSKARQAAVPDDKAEVRQCLYWQDALSFTNYLVYHLRTEKGAPLRTEEVSNV